MDASLSRQLVALLLFVAVGGGCTAMVWLVIWHARRRGTFSPFTEDMLRLPGHTLRKRVDDGLGDVFGFFLQCLLLGAVASWLILTRGPPIGFAALIAYILYRLWRLARLTEELRSLSLGYEGEVYTGQELGFLMTRGAFVFHDLPYRYGNVDHVIVGHDKVLVVETKARRKPLSGNSGRSREATVRIASVARSVSPRSRLSDPNAAEHYDAWFEPRYREKTLGAD